MSAADPHGAAGPATAMVWPIAELQRSLCEVVPGCTVEVQLSLDSTNSELMRRARAGAVAPVLLVAECQTAGRGRLGRNWLSAPVQVGMQRPVASSFPALTFSIGLTMAPQDWSGLSLAVGVCVASTLHLELGLKWPNDIWLQERKLAGILIETAAAGAARYVVVGVGINLAPRDPAGLSTPPAWLQELLPALDAPAVLMRLALPLMQALRQFENQGFTAFQAAFQQRDVLRGRQVLLSDGVTGTAVGVDEQGALLVHTAIGMKRINSAEVSVRPVPARSGVI